MEPKMIVYALSHPITGEVRYLGKSERGLRRPKEHGQRYHYKRLGHTPLYRWIKKLRDQGLDYVIEVVEEFSDRQSLMEGERFYISYFRWLGFRLLNLCDGGEGFTGRHTPEAKAKIAEASRGRTHTKETRKLLSEQRLGVPLSESHRQALRVPKTGAGAKGVPKSESHRRAISKVQEGRVYSPETILKIAKSKGAKPFMDETGRIFQTQCEAARHHKLDQGSVRMVLIGKSVQAGGHIFRYLEQLAPGEIPTQRSRLPRAGGRPRKQSSR